MKNNLKHKRILIATGIYPPDIGGPARYAFELGKIWKTEGYDVTVKYFSFERKLPTGVRHIWFLIKSLPSIFKADFILVLDTFSVALPIAIGASLCGKQFIVRTGGDFLWEMYTERTKIKVLLKNFYKESINNFSFKEKLIFRITKWILNRAKKITFSTDWQRNIWTIPYNLEKVKTGIIENYYGEHFEDKEFQSKIFIGATRKLVWKNLDVLEEIFNNTQIKDIGAKLDLDISSYDDFIQRIKGSFAVILITLGDISPNIVLDAIRCNKPFIVTNEIGIYDRIKGISIFVNPLDANGIKEKVLWLCDESNYLAQKRKVQLFSFRHSWQEISKEFLSL